MLCILLCRCLHCGSSTQLARARPLHHHSLLAACRAEVEAEGKGHVLQAMLLQLEQAWADRYTEGTNPRLASIAYYRHLEEPLKVVYKPLAFYAGSEVAAGLKHVLLLACGFKCHEHRGYTYYTYGLDPCSASPGAESSCNSSGGSKEPIVFLHGVGAGLLPYLHFVQRLVATGHPLLAAEYKHLSMRWTDDIPSSQQVARDMLCIMDRHGVGRATLVSHSFGTIFTSCLLKQAPERVRAAAGSGRGRRRGRGLWGCGAAKRMA